MADIVTKPLAFETESIDTKIAMVRWLRQKLSKKYCQYPFKINKKIINYP